MKSKYVKPTARNFGESIPEAMGVCKSGGSAFQGAIGGTGNCTSGLVANSAGACNAGGSAGGDCGRGSLPFHK